MVLATYDSGLYKICLILHILCAIVGFGAVFLNGIYGQQMKTRLQSGRVAEAIGIFEANMTVSKIGEYFIYAVFVFGFAVLGLSDSVWKFSQTWVWLSVLIYVLALGLSHGVLFPTAKRMGVLMHEMAAGPPPVGGSAAAGRGDGAAREEDGRRRAHPQPHAHRHPLPDGVEARTLTGARRAVR